MTRTEHSIEALKALIVQAAEIGKLTLDEIEDGEDFESVAEWMEYAGVREIEDVAISAGLASDTIDYDAIEERIRARQLEVAREAGCRIYRR